MEAANVFVRGEQVDKTVRVNVWDDEVLIKAYNRSVNGIKQKIAQRIGVSDGTSDDAKKEDVSKECATKVQNNCLKKGQRKKKWEVGDYCRAVYSEDRLEYEGQIINFLPDGHCVVKYCGYNNEETVKIKDLKQSLGENSRVAQVNAVSGQSENESQQLSENIKGNNNLSKISLPHLAGIPAVPPPPAFNLMSELNQENESDALSAMLMSWYMSGYHTGYYQGLMQAKKQNQKSSDCNNSNDA